MKEYFNNLFIVALAACVGQLICENADIKKSGIYSAIKLICSLCICLSVFSFFISDEAISETKKIIDDAVNEIHTFSAEASLSSDGYLLDQTKKELQSSLSNLIYDKTGIKPVYAGINFNVQQTETGKKIEFSEADIIFSRDTGDEILYAAELLTEGILGCNVTVKREVG